MGWSTCQAQMTTDSFPPLSRELTEESVPAMPKASSASESDQRDESARDGARAFAAIAEEQHNLALGSAWWLLGYRSCLLAGHDHHCSSTGVSPWESSW